MIRRAILGVGVLGLVLGSSGAALATAFTLENPIVIDGSEVGNPGVLGTLNPVLLSSVPDAIAVGCGGTCTTGTVNFPAQDFFVFDLTLDPGSADVDEIGASVLSTSFFINPVGAGAFTGAGNDPDSVTADPFVTLRATYSYATTHLTAGQTTLRLFLTHSPQGDMLIGQQVNFMISSGTNFTVQGTIIPEPGTFLLLGGGLAILGLRAARRRGVR